MICVAAYIRWLKLNIFVRRRENIAVIALIQGTQPLLATVPFQNVGVSYRQFLKGGKKKRYLIAQIQ
jgi:hypothetical protein